jgi:hypothetical protein
VHSREHVFSVADISFQDNDVILAIPVVDETDYREMSEFRRKIRHGRDHDADFLRASRAIEGIGAFSQEFDILGDDFLYGRYDHFFPSALRSRHADGPRISNLPPPSPEWQPLLLEAIP